MVLSKYPTRILAGVTVPDTLLITKALDFVRQECSELTFNHVVRTWLFGALVASKHLETEGYDTELFAISAILHDLAWDCSRPQFVSKDKRFEVDSANAARDFLRREAPHWDERKLQLSWDAIALHTISSIASYKEPEVFLTASGVGLDLLGPTISQGRLTQEEFDNIVDEFPRLNIKENYVDLMCQLCKSKPSAVFDGFVSEIGTELVEGFSMEGKKGLWKHIC